MVNKAIIIGNLGKDPEVRYTAGGQAVCNMRVATSRSWTDKQSNQKKEETEWHDVEVWGKQAESCGEYLAKGRTVYVEGRLKTDQWDDKTSGQKRSRVKIVAEGVRFLGGKGGGKKEEAQQDLPAPSEFPDSAAPPTSGSGPDDIPF